MDFSGAKTYILRKLRQELPRNLYYHGLHHTWDVYNAAQQIANIEGVTPDERVILYTASLYHDAGFISTYHDNEPIAVELIHQVLPDFGYEPKQIEAIGNIIMSTRLNIDPVTPLEFIMCDADHDYFGRSDYHIIAETLYRELAEYGLAMTDLEWVERQIHFLETKHQFYTESSIAMREKRKEQNLQELRMKLDRLSGAL